MYNYSFMGQKFYYCKSCGNLIVKLVDSGVDPYCCGREMIDLTPNTTDGDGEKHLPVVTFPVEGLVKVEVGSVPHPMSRQHYIQMVMLQTESGFQVRWLKPEGNPSALFYVGEDKPTAVYEFCNIHGLWRTEL